MGMELRRHLLQTKFLCGSLIHIEEVCKVVDTNRRHDFIYCHQEQVNNWHQAKTAGFLATKDDPVNYEHTIFVRVSKFDDKD